MPKKKTADKRGPGRPKGSKNKKRDVVVADLTHCASCGSTDREAYHGISELDHNGIDPQGNPYNRVTWKRTKCSACGQNRVDQFFERRAE